MKKTKTIYAFVELDLDQVDHEKQMIEITSISYLK
jgi:hypothetical protein